MFKARHFATGSNYNGCYNDLLHRMEGFGQYSYPDGSSYRGYFKDGNFHGYGSLQLCEPFKFSISGIYENGALIDLDEMVFGDGLVIRAPLIGDKLNTSEWIFCSSEDRRFGTEIMNELDGVGSTLITSKEHALRKLPDSTYDTGEGIYRPETGFLTSIPQPFKARRYIPCNMEQKWIKENCRYSCVRSDHISLRPEVCKFILNTNFKEMGEMGEKTRRCACRFAKGLKLRCKYYSKLQKRLDRLDEQARGKEQGTGDNYVALQTDKPRDVCHKFLSEEAAVEQAKLDSDVDVSLPLSSNTSTPASLSCIRSLREEYLLNCKIEVSTLNIPKQRTPRIYKNRFAQIEESSDFSILEYGSELSYSK